MTSGGIGIQAGGRVLHLWFTLEDERCVFDSKIRMMRRHSGKVITGKEPPALLVERGGEGPTFTGIAGAFVKIVSS